MTTWQDRAVEATHGNGSQFGAIILCALGRGKEDDAPAFHGRANITSDGYLMCDFRSRDGRGHMGAFVGSVKDFEMNAWGLAAHLKLTPPERQEFFDVLCTWVETDWRTGKPFAIDPL